MLAQSVGQDNVDSLLTQARQLYINRHLADSNFTQSKKIWEDILSINYHNEEVLRGLAELNYNLGDKEKRKTEKFSFFEKGMVFAETLIRVNYKNPWGHFWFASNYGEFCRTRGILKSLTAIPRLKSEFSQAAKLDSMSFDAIYALGVVYHEAPGFAGGDKKKAVKYFQSAIELDSNYTLPYIDLARYLFKQQES